MDKQTIYNCQKLNKLIRLKHYKQSPLPYNLCNKDCKDENWKEKKWNATVMKYNCNSDNNKKSQFALEVPSIEFNN